MSHKKVKETSVAYSDPPLTAEADPDNPETNVEEVDNLKNLT